MKYYRVYGKKSTEKRYKPYDMCFNKFVANLIHASMFTEDQLTDLEEEVKFMNTENEGYSFIVRNVSRERTAS